MLRFLEVTLLSCFLYAQVSAGQTVSKTSVASDPQGIALANAAMIVLTDGAAITDVTLTGTATQIAGSTTNTGPSTFKALAYSRSRLEFSASNEFEVRTVDPSGHPAGVWVLADGVPHAMSFHNLWTDAVWFFPALSSLNTAGQSNAIAKYVGQENRDGVAVQHLRFTHSSNDTGLAAAASDISRFSRVEIYLDASTSLPVGLSFNVHPNNDASQDIPVEILYSDYRRVLDANVPFHIQQFLGGGLILDFQVTQVTINSGLTDAAFSTQ